MNSADENRIIPTEYSELMQKSYIDYSMSVIIARAIPDIRDGLKPVQRRILYDMHDLGLKYDRPHRKSAKIVGDAMGRFHPHGDSSIYDALVVMAQEFKKGATLVDGHGNFGSIEGDPEAASRYTESRLTKIAQDVFLSDLDKGIVDFVANFDASEKEPSVLPVRIPNILVNGSEGIAVGMTTSTPTHNIGEVVDAVIAYMKKNDISTADLMTYIQGPDFPTGGIVANKDELLEIYETGVGKIRLRGRVEVEELKGGKKRLVITEIPYTMIGVGISKFLNDVASLAESKTTNDIVDILNQSSRDGIRIVIELRKDANVERLKNLLYKKTRLEDTFGVNMLAVVDGRPETLGLKEIIRHHVDFQYETTTRKYNTLLEKELIKKEIQEGLIKATDIIDLIIEVLRGSKNTKDAKACLMLGQTENITFKKKTSEKAASELCFTERQAQAILDMRLQKLIGLELSTLKKEYKETEKNVKTYKKILEDRATMTNLIIADLERIKSEYSRPRRTIIENSEQAVVEAIKVEEQQLIMLMDKFGYTKTIDINTYEKNKTAILAESQHIINCINTSKICIFTNKGQMHQVKVMDIPHGRLRDKGTPIDNISNYSSANEDIVFMCDEKALTGKKLLFTTKQGMMKQVDGAEFIVSKRTIAATKLLDNDEVVSVQFVESKHNIILSTNGSTLLKFASTEVPEKKKGAVGVRGIKLVKNDYVDDVYLYEDGVETKIEYHNKPLVLNRLKMSKRDSAGTKQR
jgi:DNA gyrase subunit A